MSLGPSSFLSSGFDLDPPQIEITLDDIFSANNAADWSQFGIFLHNTHRPKSLRSNAQRKDGEEEDVPKTECTNCKTTTTPLWRRDEQGQSALHKESRPIALKTDRFDAATAPAPRKRQDRRKQKNGEMTGLLGVLPQLPTQPSIAGTPMAPSYTANGTQLLNSADVSSSGGSSGSYTQQVQPPVTQPVDFRRHSTALPELPSMASTSRQPMDVPHRASLSSYDAAAVAASAAVGSPMGGGRALGGSINIPMSPQPVARGESSPGGSHALPPLANGLQQGTRYPAHGFGSSDGVPMHTPLSAGGR
ncbi:hypothetical protein DL89DRAFT_269598 [Linderina pennispora]|uniref:GATA-type domain-containing protein n=1 Tax=Linderina pennispora TaxID=61395 RepID=A0A1Y1W230_9FUNG|nr:uncharacterized protein DL89DRAFT_269598 [Linderina pennispora]ORX67174.1 hypothetical protein DL89DRAFT_269598 [Linderina pennispora]